MSMCKLAQHEPCSHLAFLDKGLFSWKLARVLDAGQEVIGIRAHEVNMVFSVRVT